MGCSEATKKGAFGTDYDISHSTLRAQGGQSASPQRVLPRVARDGGRRVNHWHGPRVSPAGKTLWVCVADVELGELLRAGAPDILA